MPLKQRNQTSKKVYQPWQGSLVKGRNDERVRTLSPNSLTTQSKSKNLLPLLSTLRETSHLVEIDEMLLFDFIAN